MDKDQAELHNRISPILSCSLCTESHSCHYVGHCLPLFSLENPVGLNFLVLCLDGMQIIPNLWFFLLPHVHEHLWGGYRWL